MLRKYQAYQTIFFKKKDFFWLYFLRTRYYLPKNDKKNGIFQKNFSLLFHLKKAVFFPKTAYFTEKEVFSIIFSQKNIAEIQSSVCEMWKESVNYRKNKNSL